MLIASIYIYIHTSLITAQHKCGTSCLTRYYQLSYAYNHSHTTIVWPTFLVNDRYVTRRDNTLQIRHNCSVFWSSASAILKKPDYFYSTIAIMPFTSVNTVPISTLFRKWDFSIISKGPIKECI